MFNDIPTKVAAFSTAIPFSSFRVSSPSKAMVEETVRANSVETTSATPETNSVARTSATLKTGSKQR